MAWGFLRWPMLPAPMLPMVFRSRVLIYLKEIRQEPLLQLARPFFYVNDQWLECGAGDPPCWLFWMSWVS